MSTASPIFPKSYTSLPYGDALSSIGTDPIHFTGKERDTESGLDYFGARYIASTTGRFMVPDPTNLTDARLLNPANTMNKYVCGGNNPLKYVDPDGKDITIFYESPSIISLSAGHILFTAENQQTDAAAVMSFGPVRSGSICAEDTLLGNSMPSTTSFGLSNV
jgi:RHS repeat-associated protein